MTRAPEPRGQNEESLEPTPSELRLRALLSTLLTRSRDESLAWEVDDSHPDSYCVIGSDWLIATRSVDGDGASPYALLIADGEGRPVLEVRSTSAFGRPLADRFAALHSAAAASAALRASASLVGAIVKELARPR
jgi:hypothetical protein